MDTLDGYDGVYGGYGVGERILGGRMLSQFCLEKELCVANTWIMREEKRKVTFTLAENDMEIFFVLIKKNTGSF